MERNPDYWNEGTAVSRRHRVLSPHTLGAQSERRSWLASRLCTRCRPGQPEKIQDSRYVRHRLLPERDYCALDQQREKPFSDPRVRRAMHLVLDRHALTELVKDVSPSLLGGFLYPFSEYATPAKLVRAAGLSA